MNHPVQNRLEEIIEYIDLYKTIPGFDVFYKLNQEIILFGTEMYYTFVQDFTRLLETCDRRNICTIANSGIISTINLLEGEENIPFNTDYLTIFNNQLNDIMLFINRILKECQYQMRRNPFIDFQVDRLYNPEIGNDLNEINLDEEMFRFVIMNWEDYIKTSNIVYHMLEYCQRLLYKFNSYLNDKNLKQLNCQLIELMIYNRLPNYPF